MRVELILIFLIISLPILIGGFVFYEKNRRDEEKIYICDAIRKVKMEVPNSDRVEIIGRLPEKYHLEYWINCFNEDIWFRPWKSIFDNVECFSFNVRQIENTDCTPQCSISKRRLDAFIKKTKKEEMEKEKRHKRILEGMQEKYDNNKLEDTGHNEDNENISETKAKDEFVTYDEAIKEIIKQAPESNIVRMPMEFSEETKLTYWRYIINRHFFSSYKTGIDYNDCKYIKIRTFNGSTFGQISVKNLNEFIKSIKEEVKKQEEEGIKFYYANPTLFNSKEGVKFFGELDD